MSQMTDTQIADQVAAILADFERRAAAIAATDYRMRAVLQHGFDRVIITVEPDLDAASWEVAGVGFEAVAGGERVGGVARKFFGELADAQAYANRWFADLVAKGYRRVS